MVPPRDMPKKLAKKAPKRGRPPKSPDERKSVALSLRVTADEKRLLERAAAAKGLSMTSMILAAVKSFYTETD